MIKYLKNSEIDKEKWNKCIERSINEIIYAYSWYLDVVCEGWEALIEGEYEKVMPLTVGKKYGIQYLYQPYFSQQLGVFSENKLEEEDIHCFFNAIPLKYKFIDINLNSLNVFYSEKYFVKSNSNYELKLAESYEKHYNSYSENTKRNCKKAIKHEIEIKELNEPMSIITIFQEKRGKTLSHLKKDFYDILLRVMDVSVKKRAGKIVGAFSKENRLFGGAFFIETKKRCIFLFSGVTEAGKETGAMSFLIDRYIFEKSGTNTVIDFEGSNDIDLARFYKGFGAKELNYLQVKQNSLPWYIKWYKN